MDRATTEHICHSVAEATAGIRDVFRSRKETSEILDRFWCVQDQLNRVLDAASDDPEEFFDGQQQLYPSLIPNIVDVLRFAATSQFVNIAAVKQSCESINDLLIKIMMLKTSGFDYYTASI